MKDKNSFWTNYVNDIKNLMAICEETINENKYVELFEAFAMLINIPFERDSLYNEIFAKIEMFEATNNFLVLSPSVSRAILFWIIIFP